MYFNYRIQRNPMSTHENGVIRWNSLKEREQVYNGIKESQKYQQPEEFIDPNDVTESGVESECKYSPVPDADKLNNYMKHYEEMVANLSEQQKEAFHVGRQKPINNH